MIQNNIRAILETDRQARRMEEQTEENRRQIPQSIEQRRHDLQMAYENQIKEAVENCREEQKRRLATEKAAIDARQTQLLAAMAEQVNKQHDCCVDSLVKRITEQE